MKNLTTAAGLILGAAFIAIAVFATQPRYQIVEVPQSFNNGFGAWRLDMRSGEVYLCSITPATPLVCSKPALELEDQEVTAAPAAAPVAEEAPAEEAAE